MKEFRDDLLELLSNNSGEFVEITDLVDKYCGKGNTFDPDDCTKIECRQSINRHLNELREMGWIDVNPNVLSTSHHMIEGQNLRQFMLDYRVRARLKTKGEINYKSMKRGQHEINSISIGDGFSGTLITNTTVSHSTLNTLGQIRTEQKSPEKQKFFKRLFKFLLNHIAAIIVGIISAVIAGYILWKMGWI